MVILAFDQSYTRIGYSVAEDGKPIFFGSFKIEKFFDKTIKRSFVYALAKSLNMKYNPDMVVCEQVRLKNAFGINLNSIKALAELVSVIVDAVHNKSVFTIDSKSWKAKVVGNSSADKEETVKFVKDNFEFDVDHDCADAICMSIYPTKNKPILNLYD